MKIFLSWLSGQSPVVPFILGIVLTLLLVLLVYIVVFWRRNHYTTRQLSSLTHKFQAEKMKSDAIIADLDIGVLAYGNDGRLSLSNKAALSLLDGTEQVQRFDDFMTAYGEENGVKARLILGSGEAAGNVHVGGKVLRMQVKESKLEDQQRVATIVILQDITDQEMQESQRKEFVANVSHELKTPLTTIITYTESLLDWGLEEKQPEGVRKDVVRIYEDANRMEGLVTDLLLLSSIDSRKMTNRFEILDLDLVVRQSVERMQVQAQEKQIELDCTAVSILPPVFADRSSIERIMSNLLSNAIKYTDRKGKVTVYLGRVHDAVYVKVQDNGFGIEEKNLGQLFNRFYRVDMTGSRRYGGTGLGLSIVKELVDMHNGQIDVQSSLGKGSTFTVMIPFASKVFQSTLTDYLTGSPPTDNLSLAAAGEIVAQANERGVPIKRLGDLSQEQAERLLGWYNGTEDESEDDTGPDDHETTHTDAIENQTTDLAEDGTTGQETVKPVTAGKF